MGHMRTTPARAHTAAPCLTQVPAAAASRRRDTFVGSGMQLMKLRPPVHTAVVGAGVVDALRGRGQRVTCSTDHES